MPMYDKVGGISILDMRTSVFTRKNAKGPSLGPRGQLSGGGERPEMDGRGGKRGVGRRRTRRDTYRDNVFVVD